MNKDESRANSLPVHTCPIPTDGLDCLKSNFNGLSVPFISVFSVQGNDLCTHAACWGYLKNKWSAFRGQQHHSLQRDTIIHIPRGIITFILYFNVFVFIQH